MLQKIILSAVDRDLSIAWKAIAKEYDFVEAVEGDICDLEVDAVVSPANSFGFMDGGIDWIYSQFFGWGVQTDLQKQIKDVYNNELLVGQATCVPTKHKQIRYVIAAPTMRTPQTLPKNTINPYLAAKAALRAAMRTPDIYTLAFPGLGTGVGEVSPELCAHQVKEAIDEVLCGTFMFPVSWHDSSDRETALYTLPEE